MKRTKANNNTAAVEITGFTVNTTEVYNNPLVSPRMEG